jgi:DNA-binding NarL/FixJ family response regulator
MSGASVKPLDGCRILLAEDEPLLLIDLNNMLVLAGAVIVGPAASVQSALFLAKSETVHCGVLNVKLKDGDVDPVAELLYRGGKGLVFVTSLNVKDKLLRNWPSSKVLEKPASEKDLINAAVTACRSCRGA